MKYNQYFSFPICLNTAIFIIGLLWIRAEKYIEFEPYIVSLTGLFNALYRILSINKINHIIEFANENIRYDRIENKYKDIPRISVLGLPSSGKTTLIENLVHFDNRNTATQEKSAYLLELATTKQRFAFILDDRGNSQLNQNILLGDGDYILLLLDHNQSNIEIEYNEDRIIQTKVLVTSLILKLMELKKFPKCIYVVINKLDLMKDRDVITRMKALAQEFLRIIEKETQGKIPVFIYEHTNMSSNSINKIYRELVKRINYDS